MKTLITASVVALGLFTASAQAAPRGLFTDIDRTAPLAGTFGDLQETAPRSFGSLNDTAPRSGVYGDLNETAPKAGTFGDLQETAPRSK